MPALFNLLVIFLLALDKDLLQISYTLIDHALFVLVLAFWLTNGLLEGAVLRTFTPSTTWKRVRHQPRGALPLLSFQIRER